MQEPTMNPHANEDHQVPSEALIYHNGIPVAIVPTKGISRSGLEVNCGPMHYARNTQLEVEMAFAPDRRGSRFRIPVHVEECTRNHMALEFDDLPEGFPPVLRHLTQARQPEQVNSSRTVLSH